MSTDAQDALSEGLDELDSQLGESFVVSGVVFTARREQREVPLPDYSGTIQKTVLHVRRANLPSTLPAVGALISKPGGLTARLASVKPGALAGMLVLELADEFA